ncbi:MAG: hypothetical protein QOK15_2327 [Nocardioidaceae bacterium]|jgi:Tol biopolymer transport system component|nr:hypothetical protein [Nocardioidaceae bacterium]
MKRLLFVSACVIALVLASVALPGAQANQAVTTVQNGRLAFSTDFSPRPQIYTMRPDGAGVRQLTHVPKGHAATQPRWSPDGTRIAFELDSRIWVMNANGTGQKRLTGRPGFEDHSPAWSPDGTTIVFSRCNVQLGFDAYCDIDRISAHGTGLTTILHDNWKGGQPTYSPNGREIAFTTDRGGFISAVWVMRADGSHPRRLTDPVLEANGPDWSPDGTHILFGINSERPGGQVWVTRTDGSHPHRVSPFGKSSDAPAGRYSPDGRRIVLLGPNVAHPHVCCWDVYLMRSDGSHVQLIDHGQPGVVGLDWGARPRS